MKKQLYLILIILLVTACRATSTARLQPVSTRTTLPDYLRVGARDKYSFEEIVSFLSSPVMVGTFMKNNVVLDPGYDNRIYSTNQYDPARMVYENGIDGDGYAILQCNLLEKNGWNAVMAGL